MGHFSESMPLKVESTHLVSIAGWAKGRIGHGKPITVYNRQTTNSVAANKHGAVIVGFEVFEETRDQSNVKYDNGEIRNATHWAGRSHVKYTLYLEMSTGDPNGWARIHGHSYDLTLDIFEGDPDQPTKSYAASTQSTFIPRPRSVKWNTIVKGLPEGTRVRGRIDRENGKKDIIHIVHITLDGNLN